MKKRLTALLMVVVCIMSFAVGAMGKSVVEKIEAELREDFEIVIDGKKTNFKDASGNRVYPILYEGTTYLPVRAIGEMMGKTVYWYQDEKRIELVEKTEEPLVTDADVIVDGADKVKGKEDKEIRAKKEEVVKDVKITLDKAKSIALDKAGVKEADVVFEEAKLDFDDGRWVYDIEFRHGYVEYSAEIDTTDGKILKWEKDVD